MAMDLLSVLLSQMPVGPTLTVVRQKLASLLPLPLSTEGMSLYGTVSPHSHWGKPQSESLEARDAGDSLQHE